MQFVQEFRAKYMKKQLFKKPNVKRDEEKARNEFPRLQLEKEEKPREMLRISKKAVVVRRRSSKDELRHLINEGFEVIDDMQCVSYSDSDSSSESSSESSSDSNSSESVNDEVDDVKQEKCEGESSTDQTSSEEEEESDEDADSSEKEEEEDSKNEKVSTSVEGKTENRPALNYEDDPEIGDIDGWMREARRNFEEGELDLHQIKVIVNWFLNLNITKAFSPSL